MIKAVIFDCFGVLVGRGFEETYRIAGGDPAKDREFINSQLGQANLGMISEAVFHQEMAAKLGLTIGEWQSSIQQAEKPNAELLNYIKAIHGRYKTVILSNANRGVVESRIGDDCVKQCFDKLVISAEIGMIKPDPDIYSYAAEQLGVEPDECVFVDDKAMFLEPARELGMHTVHYRDFSQAKAELETILSADTKS